MPGYMLHFGACAPELLENESFRKGVEAPDILKKWISKLGLVEARNKYFAWRTPEMPMFSRFEGRALARDDDKGMGLHYGWSSAPDIMSFWSSLTEEEQKLSFWRGYLWHLITDQLLYGWLDTGARYKVLFQERLDSGISYKEAQELENRRLHDDWDRTNELVHSKYPEIELPLEVKELNVVKFINDGQPLTYVDWDKVERAIAMLRQKNPLKDDAMELISWGTKVTSSADL